MSGYDSRYDRGSGGGYRERSPRRDRPPSAPRAGAPISAQAPSRDPYDPRDDGYGPIEARRRTRATPPTAPIALSPPRRAVPRRRVLAGTAGAPDDPRGPPRTADMTAAAARRRRAYAVAAAAAAGTTEAANRRRSATTAAAATPTATMGTARTPRFDDRDHDRRDDRRAADRRGSETTAAARRRPATRTATTTTAAAVSRATDTTTPARGGGEYYHRDRADRPLRRRGDGEHGVPAEVAKMSIERRARGEGLQDRTGAHA